MDKKIKDYLIWAIIVVLFVFAYASISYVRSYDKSIEPSSFRSFSVSGEGEVIVVPDVAEFSFKVITEGDEDIAVLQKENTSKMNNAIEFLKANGVDAKDIKTLTYDLDPRYTKYSDVCDSRFFEDGRCPPPEIVGYTIVQSVLVKIRDFSKIGIIFSGVVEKGINSVGGLDFTIDDPDAVLAEARNKAIAEARTKAEAIAKEADFGVGRLLSIREGSSPWPVYYEDSIRSLGVGGAAAIAPTIEPGSQEVKISVTLTYEIK